MVTIAAKEPCGASGYTWDKAGEAGAQEVGPRLAHELLSIPGDPFFIVATSKKVSPEDLEAAKKAEDDAEAEKLQRHYDDAQAKAGIVEKPAKAEKPKAPVTKTVKTEGPNNA